MLGCLLGSVLCIITIWTFEDNVYGIQHNSSGLSIHTIGSFIDTNVLIILSSIMIINFVIMKQPYVLKLITYMQLVIQKPTPPPPPLPYSFSSSSNIITVYTSIKAYIYSLYYTSYGFYTVCMISFCISPFIMNDGVCLLLTCPVIDGFIYDTVYTKDSVNVSNNDSSSALDDRVESNIYNNDNTNTSNNIYNTNNTNTSNNTTNTTNNTNIHNNNNNTSNNNNNCNNNSATNIHIQHNHKHKQQIALYYLLGLCCSANYGSCLTYTGNPQNIIISQNLSKILTSGVFFTLFMCIPAFVGWIITITYINHHRLLYMNTHTSISTSDDMLMENGNCNNNNNTSTNTDVAVVNANTMDNTSNNTISIANTTISQPPIGISSRYTACMFIILILLEFIGIFPLVTVFSFISILLVSGVLLINYYKLMYRIYVTPTNNVIISTTTNTMNDTRNNSNNTEGTHYELVDVNNTTNTNTSTITTNDNNDNITNNTKNTNTTNTNTTNINTANIIIQLSHYREAMNIYLDDLFLHGLDYTLLIIFTGLFVVSGAFVATNIPNTIWKAFNTGQVSFGSVGSICSLTVYIILASQLIGKCV